MATKRIIPLNRITNVVAGSTATIDLPTGLRYHSIHFEYNTATAGGPTEANIEAHLTQWRMNLETVEQRTFSSAQLYDINRTKGKSPVVGASNGYIDIYLSEPQRLTKMAREATAWGTLGVDKFQIEVDIAAGATTPVLTGWAVVDDVPEPPRGIVKWKREVIQVSAAGDITYQLNTNRGDSYQGLFLFETTAADINEILLTWDGLKVVDIDENVYTALMPASGLSIVSGLKYVSLDGGNPDDALPSVKNRGGQLVKVSELLLTMNMEGARNVTCIREAVGGPD